MPLYSSSVQKKRKAIIVPLVLYHVDKSNMPNSKRNSSKNHYHVRQ